MDETRHEARQFADLAITIALEESLRGRDPAPGWMASRCLELISACGGSPQTIRAAIDLLDPTLDADARKLLVSAEYCAAFWGD
jgi:hypothetical protein